VYQVSNILHAYNLSPEPFAYAPGMAAKLFG